ncbi:MAG: hypothetical protein R3B09_12605 [Nannocystaceae bacterium]
MLDVVIEEEALDLALDPEEVDFGALAPAEVAFADDLEVDDFEVVLDVGRALVVRGAADEPVDRALVVARGIVAIVPGRAPSRSRNVVPQVLLWRVSWIDIRIRM